MPEVNEWDDVAYRPNQYIDAGLLARGNIRRALARGGVEFKEIKSWDGSVFQVKCSPSHWNHIVRQLREYNNS